MEQLTNTKGPGRYALLTATLGPERWRYDDPEEFFAGFPEADTASFVYEIPLNSQYWLCRLSHSLYSTYTSIEISSELRTEIQTVMNVFRSSQEQAIRIHEPNGKSESKEQDFSIFIGHGHSPDWKELRDHLRDQHQYNIVTFETGARAGHHIRDILDEMLDQSSLAFLVLSGEDETADDRVRARQNVIHETGLFQGRLGFSKAIVVLEEGVEEFSNNAGIQHISYVKGHIDGIFGHVVATIKREMKRHGLDVE